MGLGVKGKACKRAFTATPFPSPGEGMKGRGATCVTARRPVTLREEACKRAFTVRTDYALMQDLWSHEEGFERKL